MAIAEVESEAPGRRARASEDRRQRVLAAARVCFGRDGYAGATVARIAEEAGVSNGLLYQFFRNKDELLDVVLREVVRDWVRAMLPEDDAQGAADTIEGMFRRSVEFCRNHPLLPALMAGDPALKLQRVSMAAADRVEPHRELISGILRRGIGSGELRADLDVEASADVISQLHGDYSRRAYANDPMFPLDARIVDEVARFMRRAISP